MDIRHLPNYEQVKHMGTTELRSNFLIGKLFSPGQIQLVYCHADRMIVGGAVPMDTTLTLKATAESYDTELTYRWEQIEGDEAPLTWPEEPMTDVELPEEAQGTFGFRITVTDSHNRQGNDEVILTLPLGQ